MADSKIKAISELLDGTEHMKPSQPLMRYHRAKDIRDATAKRGHSCMLARLARVKKALSQFAVNASLVKEKGKGERIRLFRADTGKELVL